MVTFGIIAICAILLWVAKSTSFYIFKFLAGVAFIGLHAWWTANPIGGDASSPVQTIFLMLTMVVGVSCGFWAFWDVRASKNGQETGGRFRMPFMPTDEQEEEERQRNNSPSRAERNAIYRSRVDNALRGRTKRRY